MSSATVPVTVQGFTWASALMALLNVIAGGVLATMIRTRPTLKKLANEREAANEATRSQDMADMRKRIIELETKVEAVTATAHHAEMRLVHAVAAVQLLAAKIRAENPGDPTLKQAMELLAAATTGALTGWAAKLADGVDRIKGAGE